MSQDTSIPGGKPFPSLRELTGTVIDGRYQIGRLLGTGGMGAVYEAMQLRLDRRVAIKILNPVYMHREDYVGRFMREAKAASKIRHANVVQMMDFGELPGGSVYSVMEFLEGRDLADVLQKAGRLPWPRARDLMLQMARGLRAAHEQGVIHRDIKPANLFLVMRRDDDDGHKEVLKVLDFGIARMQSQPSQNTSALTGTAELLGTPSYMAPELARGRSANPRSEVYSVGVVAYRMLTGRLPFEGETAFDVLFRSATEDAPPMRAHDPSLPEAVDQLVMRMIARDPEQRFDQMAELYKAISAIDEAGRLTAPNTTGPNPAVAAAPMPMPMPAPASVPYPPVATPAAPTPYPPGPVPYPTGPIAAPAVPPPGPQVVVPPPLSSAAMQAAADAARAGQTAPVLETHATPSSSDLHRMPTPGLGEVTHPGLYEPTPGSMRMPMEPAGGATLPVTDLAGFDTPTGPGQSYDTLTGPAPRRDLRPWYIGGAIAFALSVVVGIVAASWGDDAAHDDAGSKDAKTLQAPAIEPESEAKVEPPTPDPSVVEELPEPANDDAAAEDDDAADDASEPDAPTIVDDTPSPEPTQPPPTEPRRDDAAPKVPATTPKSPSSGNDKAFAQVTSKLKQQAKKSCGSLLGGKPLTVKFAVGANGKTMMIRTDGGPVLDKCVKKVVEEGDYPTSPRTHQEKFRL